MNNKVTFPELVEAVAKSANTSKRLSESFLKELFATICAALESGENVKIKNLGTFKVVTVESRRSVNVNTGEEIEIASHKKVTFTPDKSLAEAINMPFEGFETIVLDDEISDADLKRLSDTDEVRDDTASESSADAASLPEETATGKSHDEDDESAEGTPPVFAPKHAEEVSEAPKISTPPPFVPKPPVFNPQQPETGQQPAQQNDDDMGPYKSYDDKPEPAKTNNSLQETYESNASTVDDDYDDTDEEIAHSRRISFRSGFLWGIVSALVVCAIAGYCAYAYYSDSLEAMKQAQKTYPEAVPADTTARTSKPVSTAPASAAKSVKTATAVEVSPPAAPKIHRDTVRVNHYLTQMATRYYGKSIFWVYIYEENKAKIKNPNVINPGTVVVIPPAEKYGINRHDKQSVARAQEKAYKLANEKS